MAYNPSLYNPYGSQQFQPTTQNMNWQYQPTQTFQPQQPINGLTFIDSIDSIDTLKMPPGSVSQPYFLKDENKFVIVRFDNMGGFTKELFSFKPEPMNNNSEEFVTREYFDQQMQNIMEAINGKHSIPEQQPEA